MASGWVKSAISPTQSRSFACVVGAAAAMVWLIRGTLFIGPADIGHTYVRIAVANLQRHGLIFPLLHLYAATEGLALFDLDIGRAIDRGDLFAKRLRKARLQLFLGLGRIEHRVAAAGEGKRNCYHAQQRGKAPHGSSISTSAVSRAGGVWEGGRGQPVDCPQAPLPHDRTRPPLPPRLSWIGFPA